MLDKGESAPALDLGRLLRHDREELLYLAAEPLRAPAMAARRLLWRLRGEKPLGYIGWTGHRNLGDEVMFQVIRRAFAGIRMTPFVAPPGEAVFKAMKLGGPGFFRAVLLGGGTLINPPYLRAARMARSFGAPLFTMGTGVGSPGFGFPPRMALDGWLELLSDASVSVRGPLSALSLHEAGVKDVVTIGDPALGLTPEKRPAIRTRQRLLINLARQPGVSLSAAESALIVRMGAIAREFLRDGGEVVGVALGNGDRALLSEFRTGCCLPAMTIEEHRTSGERLLRTMVGSVGLIGVRLHSAVLASCVGVPSILIAYRDKCADFMASMDMNEFTLFLTSEASKQMARRWDRILEDRDLGCRVHSKALFWKEKQRIYYAELAARFGNPAGRSSAAAAK